MFKKNNKFTLIELIVVIAVLGILASIVIPNINNIQNKATITSIVADARNLQTSVDLYQVSHNGTYPVIGAEQPVLGLPKQLNFDLLYPDYVRDIPNHSDVNYWVDYQGQVWASTVDSPKDLAHNDNGLEWTYDSLAEKYLVYEVLDNSTQSAVSNKSIKLIDTVVELGNSTPENYDKTKTYLVSAVDIYGFESAPAKVGYTGTVDAGIDEDEAGEKEEIAHTKNYFTGYSTVEGVEDLFNSKTKSLYLHTSKPVYITWKEQEENKQVKIELQTAKDCVGATCSVQDSYVEFLDKDFKVLETYKHRSSSVTTTQADLPEGAVMIKIYNSKGTGLINYVDGLVEPEVITFLDEGFEYTKAIRYIEVPDKMKGKNVKFNLNHGLTIKSGSTTINHTALSVFDSDKKQIASDSFRVVSSIGKNEHSYTTFIPENAKYIYLQVESSATTPSAAERTGIVNSIEILD